MCVESLVRGPGRPKVAEDPLQQSHHVRCLTYRVLDNMTVPQVARRMGISERTVVNWTRLALGYHGFPEIKAIRKKLRREPLRDEDMAE